MKVASLVLWIALMLLHGASILKGQQQLKTLTLEETLFVSEKKDVERDHDNDA